MNLIYNNNKALISKRNPYTEIQQYLDSANIWNAVDANREPAIPYYNSNLITNNHHTMICVARAVQITSSFYGIINIGLWNPEGYRASSLGYALTPKSYWIGGQNDADIYTPIDYNMNVLSKRVNGDGIQTFRINLNNVSQKQKSYTLTSFKNTYSTIPLSARSGNFSTYECLFAGLWMTDLGWQITQTIEQFLQNKFNL